MNGLRALSGIALASALVVAACDSFAIFPIRRVAAVTSIRDVWVTAQLPTEWLPRAVDSTSNLVSWRDPVAWLLDAPVAAALVSLAFILWLLGRRRGFSLAESEASDNSEVSSISPQTTNNSSELRKALWSCRSAFAAIAAFSAILNVLMLTGSLFMLEIYDRVLPSRSVPTLIGLCAIAGILFAAQGLLDLIRTRLLVRVGTAINEALAARVFDALVRVPMRTGSRGENLQPLRDLDAVRAFLSGAGPSALFDLPWLPLYLGIVFTFHPLLGFTALFGAVLLIVLALATEILMRRPMRDTTIHTASQLGLADASARNAEVLAGMGFASRLRRQWLNNNVAALTSQRRASDISGGLGAIARSLRMVLQSAVLAVGAYLVIIQQASPGIIIAASILVARALAPVDIAIAHWRGFVVARQSWQRLGKLLAVFPIRAAPMALQPPVSSLQVNRVSIIPPGQQKLVVHDVDFALNRGHALGIIGPSGSGKSSLARALVGAWLPAAGSIRFDGAAIDQWAPEALGRHVGYLPQDVELFAGSVAQNIARFESNADPQEVIKAAQAADVHDLIVGLAKGYDTEIGPAGTALSAGQRQRLALARALYGDPFLVVLDEPDASLDHVGEQALQKAILGVRARGGIAIIVSHRHAVLGAVDLLLALQNGSALFGPKEIILQRLMRPPSSAVHILKPLPDASTTKS